jgi:hypothetical protein
MRILTTMLKQTCVYWAFSSIDQFGEKTFSSGVDISCRWEAKTEEFLDAMGERQLSNAVVCVDRDIAVGSVLMLGTTSDITDETTIKENAGAWEVKRFDKLPTLKATEFLRTCYL